ncbi:MAG: HAMP domain-containing sensor histidine kinase [Dehalococcoidales bacterium]|nr:HAMP domain-containing sensor histidine kinase [Dehalococcoidales bacterium]
MKSLSVKITLVYVFFTLLMIIGILSYVEYHAAEADEWNVHLRMETSFAYINGATPAEYNSQLGILSDIFNSYHITPRFVLDNFTPLTESSWSGVTVNELGKISGDGHNYYSLELGTSKVGVLIISEQSFNDTLDTFTGYGGWRKFYYMPIEGYDDVIILATLDNFFSLGKSWPERVWYDLTPSFPVILLLSLLTGFLISLLIVRPVRHIAKSAEALGKHNLDRRVKVNSNDEIGSLAKSFNRMADSIQNTIESQKRFISDAAHELKTPLASMKTTVTGAMDSEKSPQECQELLSFLSGRINTQEELIGSLLFLARADEGRLPLDMKAINLPDVIRETEDAFRYLYEDKNVELQTEMEAEIPLMADSKMLFQLFSNLLDNALKHTPSGGSVFIKAVNEKDSVSIEVKDTGEGIPEEHLPHIFERFYRVPGTNDNGFGLGTAICKSIVEAHGGDISVKSEQGKGTVVRIRLPLIN